VWRERKINDVGISAIRIWIRSTAIGVRIETTEQFLPDNGDWLYSTPLYCPASLSYARGQHGLHGARVMLSVRIADPLSGRRMGS